MKKWILFSSFVLILLCLHIHVFANEIHNLNLANVQLYAPDKNTKMIPFQKTFTALGYDVTYNNETEILSAENNLNPNQYFIDIKNNLFIVKYRLKSTSYPITIVQKDNQIYIPIAILSDYIGLYWNEEQKQFQIKEKPEQLPYPEDSQEYQEILIFDDIPYSFEKKDTTAITKYFRQHIDENFDISQYSISEKVKMYVDGKPVVGTVSLKKNAGGFATTNSYELLIQSGWVGKITIYGNPSENFEINNSISLIHITEAELKKLASQWIALDPLDKITEQRVLKKYDTEPYYVVFSEVYRNNLYYDYLHSYEYRLTNNYIVEFVNTP